MDQSYEGVGVILLKAGARCLDNTLVVNMNEWKSADCLHLLQKGLVGRRVAERHLRFSVSYIHASSYCMW